MSIIAAFASSFGAGRSVVPPKPTVTYTAENQFTISQYTTSNLIYEISGGSVSGSGVVTVPSTGITVRAKYPKSLSWSETVTLSTYAHGRVLTTVAATPSSVACGPRPNLPCPGDSIVNTDGLNYVPGPGTRNQSECGGTCPSEPFEAGCFTLYGTCYNWYWTDYSGSGYTLFGNTWGKAL